MTRQWFWTAVFFIDRMPKGARQDALAEWYRLYKLVGRKA